MVEFAIVLPILLIILFMVAEMGRALYQYNTLYKAVGHAARHFSIHHAAVDSDAQVINMVRCGWREADDHACSEPAELLIAGLDTPDAIDVELLRLNCDSAESIDDCSESDTNYDHVMIQANFRYQPMTGQTLPNLLDAALDLKLKLTATVVMRAL